MANGHHARHRIPARELGALATLFDQAVEQDPEARETLLATIPDSGVRRRVRELLLGDAHWRTVEPAILEQVGRVALAAEVPLPESIGSCRIVRRLGLGGMGEVFEAEEDGPLRRRVAVKVIRHGVDSPEALLRFRNEIQAMARMDHPDIARIFRAAVHEGRPYLVMELVGGEPLNEFLERHALNLTDRLTLLSRICRAVQHAHQRGVVHRDLKPSNVLVERMDGVLTPRLIDFGLAKATEG
jgi:hypothetical protein